MLVVLPEPLVCASVKSWPNHRPGICFFQGNSFGPSSRLRPFCACFSAFVSALACSYRSISYQRWFVLAFDLRRADQIHISLGS